jgi:hypothetical protein
MASNIGPMVGQIVHLACQTTIYPALKSAEIGAAATPAKSNPHSTAKLWTVRLLTIRSYCDPSDPETEQFDD